MRIAVVAVTKQGIGLAERVSSLLEEKGLHQTVIYVPGKFSLLSIDGRRKPFRKPLKEVFGELFAEYEGIVCIMALGIVVRLIAPYLKDKTVDPAVVVMDELGRNVISTLSGHLGGANVLSLEIASTLDANPVITTATDVNGLPAIEVLAKENGWKVEPFELVRKVNAAIVNGQKVVIYTEKKFDIELGGQIEVKDFAMYCPTRKEDGRVVLVTNRTAASFPEGTLLLRPQNLFLGIGCRRGVSSKEIMDAIEDAMKSSGRTMSSVRSLASIDIKSGEKGLLEAACELCLPVEFYSPDEINTVLTINKNHFSYSEMVNDRIGVGGVCEPSAILSAGENSELVMPKTKYRNVTVAIAEAGWL